MSQSPYAVARPAESVLVTNKLIRNTYILLSMTLLFSAFTAGLSMYLNFPYMGPLITLAGYFGLLYLTSRLRNSAWGILSVFALTGFMGLTPGTNDQCLCAYVRQRNGTGHAGARWHGCDLPWLVRLCIDHA